MKKLFFEKLVELKEEAVDFIITKVRLDKDNGIIDVNISPTDTFIIDRIEYDSGGLFVNLNNKPINIKDISRESVIMIASFLDGSWDGV